MAKIEQLTDKRGEIVYPVTKEAAVYDENGVILANKISTFITRLVDNLANYYLKSETYTKEEVNAAIAAIQGFSYVVVGTLPTASASTMGTIYLVPSSDPQAQNVKDEYITIDNGSSANPRYTWEQIGSTAIDLSGYVTTTDLNTALADYTTTANLTTLLAGKQDTIADLATIRSGASAGATAYQKPSGGIPSSDMASAAQTSLGKADTAYQKPGTGIPATDLTAAAQTSLGKADTAYQKPSSGIPKTDLSGDVQDSLELADTAVQAEPIGTIVPPVNPSEFATKEELEELEHEVHNLSGKYYGIYEDAESLPEGDAVGYAFVGTTAPFAIYQFNGEDWADSGATMDSVQGEPGADGVGFASVASPSPADGTVVITLSNGDTMTLDLNHNHPQYYAKAVETSIPSGGFLPDVAYSLGTLTGTITFALAAAVSGNLNHYFWMFDTGSTAPTVTWPMGVTWASGSAPTVAASKHYEVSILGGVAYYSEV